MAKNAASPKYVLAKGNKIFFAFSWRVGYSGSAFIQN
jgi:hypothetical protein